LTGEEGRERRKGRWRVPRGTVGRKGDSEYSKRVGGGQGRIYVWQGGKGRARKGEQRRVVRRVSEEGRKRRARGGSQTQDQEARGRGRVTCASNKVMNDL
jgi:hypothetical protein